MDRVQEIIRFLTAAGGTPSRDGNNTHFTFVEQGSVRMRTWTGSELIDDVLIADEVRPGTSAPIVNGNHKRIFVVHKDNSIKCFIDPLRDGDQVEEDDIDDDAPWNEEKIAGVDTQAHPQSQLAVSYDRNTVFVFYQKPDGTLGCLNEYNSQWKDVKLPAVAALDGTPLATCNTNYAVFLFYISTDGTVRYLENREGKWNDEFFSAAKIIDPKAELPGSVLRLTVAEDRQPFERIRPLVFCLDNDDLSIIKFRSKKVDTIGRVEGTEFVPCLGDRERNKYYFWSPYPFYTMIKRRVAQATISKGLWKQYVERSNSQQGREDSSTKKNLKRPQEPFIDNHKAPNVNNKTPPTVSVDTAPVQAKILPRISKQIEIPNGTSSQSYVFLGRLGITQPWNAIRRTFLGNARNQDTAEGDAFRNIESNNAGIAVVSPEVAVVSPEIAVVSPEIAVVSPEIAVVSPEIAVVSPETNEFKIDGVEDDAIESNKVRAIDSNTEEVRSKETGLEETANGENNMNETEAGKTFVRESRPDEVDSEGTAGESASEGTDSEGAETAPSEVEEAEIGEDKSQKAQAEEAQAEESGDQEFEDEEFEDEEFEDEEGEEGLEGDGLVNEKFQNEKSQTRESETKEPQTTEPQTTKPQTTEPQTTEPQTTEPQTTEPQTTEPQTKEPQIKEPQTKESETEKPQTEKPQTEKLRIEEHRTKEVKSQELENEEAENKEVQNNNIQPGEVQTRSVQSEEAQTKDPRTDNAQINNTKPDEYEAKASKTEESETKEQEPKNVKRREPESESASRKAKVPTTNTSTTKPVERPPSMNPSVTEGNSQEADIDESGLKHLNPYESERTEIPIIDKGKGPAATDTPKSAESRFNTPQDIEKDLNDHIKKNGLGPFFSGNPSYTRILADNAFNLKNNKDNLLNRDVDTQRIIRLNLYQPVLYCDDSTSMNASSRVHCQTARTRVDDQIEMVRRVTRVSTCVVPPGHGSSVQFINFVRDIRDNKLSQLQVEAIVSSVKPSGHTQIGTNLKEKILKPLVYDVIKSKKRLERPILVSCITDGCPSDESPGKLKKEILKCTRFLRENGYPPSTIRFQISQIGNSSRADKFLKELKDDRELKDVLYCTAQRLDDQFETFRHNELMLERWLLRTLLEPIMGEEGINSLNL